MLGTRQVIDPWNTFPRPRRRCEGSSIDEWNSSAGVGIHLHSAADCCCWTARCLSGGMSWWPAKGVGMFVLRHLCVVTYKRSRVNDGAQRQRCVQLGLTVTGHDSSLGDSPVPTAVATRTTISLVGSSCRGGGKAGCERRRHRGSR